MAVVLTATDRAGNVQTDNRLKIQIDKTKPVFTADPALTDPDMYYKAGETITFQANVTDVPDNNDQDFLTVTADLTVLSKDILTVPEEEIRKARVIWTIVGGRVEYGAGGTPAGS